MSEPIKRDQINQAISRIAQSDPNWPHGMTAGDWLYDPRGTVALIKAMTEPTITRCGDENSWAITPDDPVVKLIFAERLEEAVCLAFLRQHGIEVEAEGRAEGK